MLYHDTARLYEIHTMLMHIHMHLFKLLIDRIVIHINSLIPSLVTSELPSGEDGGLVI